MYISRKWQLWVVGRTIKQTKASYKSQHQHWPQIQSFILWRLKDVTWHEEAGDVWADDTEPQRRTEGKV
jgi:hypothetical protein